MSRKTVGRLMRCNHVHWERCPNRATHWVRFSGGRGAHYCRFHAGEDAKPIGKKKR
jgi:hypothetical protein